MKRIIMTALIQAIAITSCVGNTQAVDALVMDKIGSKTSITGILLHKTDKCGGMLYYSGTPTETTLDLLYLPLDTGDYIVKVPFSLIQQLSVAQKQKEEGKLAAYVFTVTLTNKTILRGNVHEGYPRVFNALEESDVFIGESELGSFRLPVTDVRGITFSEPNHPAGSTKATLRIADKTEPNHPVEVNRPAGPTKATLRLSDKTEIAIYPVSFVINKKNRNGCYEGDELVGMFKFKTEGGSEYELSLDKISAFTFVAGAPTFTLSSKQGQKYVGHSLNAIGITATTEIGGVTLEVIVPFATQALEIRF